MKKERTSKLVFIVLFVSVFIFAGFAFPPNFFMRYVIVPALSPFFPDFAPFEASVTISFNTAPRIIDIINEISICEDDSLSLDFNITDSEGGPLEEIRILPTFPFFIQPSFYAKSQTETIFPARIFSLPLVKSFVDRALGYRIYPTIIFVSDGQYSDFRNFIITLIERNHELIFSPVGVHTIWTRGDDTVFYHQINASDIEDGDSNSGNLNFSLSFLDGAESLFNISRNGTMYYDANGYDISSLPVTFNISVCVRDQGIPYPHANIFDVCDQTGLPFEVCSVFGLTITNENRPPIITRYTPVEINLSVNGEEKLYFNITDRDPDGTIPDTYWYVDGTFLEYDLMSNFDDFYYTFGCGIGGLHEVRVDVTDGLLNDSLYWNVIVEPVACPVSGGGGGGGSIKKCTELWQCPDWNTCQSLEKSIGLIILGGEEYRNIGERCRLDTFGANCGFQIRDCFDINACNTTLKVPEKLTHCYYTENPSCSDSIKNCHDNGCELLIDCGGPCGVCSTCSDGVNNQGEKGIDCGGPCPVCPEVERIDLRYLFFNYFLDFLLLLLLLLIIIFVIRIIRARRKIKQNLQ